MPKRGPALFFDCVTLSNFALAGRLDLLAGRYGRRVTLTTEVLDEIGDGVASGHAALREVEHLASVGRFTVTRVAPAEWETYRGLLRTLAPGEASCIACARHRHGVVATDDRAARGICSELGLPLTGTVGILKACCRDGRLTEEEADAVLADMIRAGYYSPVRRLGE